MVLSVNWRRYNFFFSSRCSFKTGRQAAGTCARRSRTPRHCIGWNISELDGWSLAQTTHMVRALGEPAGRFDPNPVCPARTRILPSLCPLPMSSLLSGDPWVVRVHLNVVQSNSRTECLQPYYSYVGCFYVSPNQPNSSPRLPARKATPRFTHLLMIHIQCCISKMVGWTPCFAA